MSAEMIPQMRPYAAPAFSELATIEFQNYGPPGAMPGHTPASAWIEGQSAAAERLRGRATALGREGHGLVIIQGEAGSGKLRVAQWIHRCSRRSDRPLMVLDATSGTLAGQLERVLRSLNRDSEMSPGTVVIRNFHVVPPDAMHRLMQLVTMQGPASRCAVILMTGSDIGELRNISLMHNQLLAGGGNSMVMVPPLRNRPGDVEILARNFAMEATRRYFKQVRGISPQGIAKLESHAFPGNIHELKNLIDQAVLRSSGDWITAECFPGIGDNHASRSMDQAEIVIRLPGSSLREIETQTLKLALRLSGGRIVRASELLGITRHALRRKLEKFNLTSLRQQYENATPPMMGRLPPEDPSAGHVPPPASNHALPPTAPLAPSNGAPQQPGMQPNHQPSHAPGQQGIHQGTHQSANHVAPPAHGPSNHGPAGNLAPNVGHAAPAAPAAPSNHGNHGPVPGMPNPGNRGNHGM